MGKNRGKTRFYGDFILAYSGFPSLGKRAPAFSGVCRPAASVSVPGKGRFLRFDKPDNSRIQQLVLDRKITI